MKPKYDTHPKRDDFFRKHFLFCASIDKPKLNTDRRNNANNNKTNNTCFNCGDFSYYSKPYLIKIKAQSVFVATSLAIKVTSTSL